MFTPPEYRYMRQEDMVSVKVLDAPSGCTDTVMAVALTPGVEGKRAPRNTERRLGEEPVGELDATDTMQPSLVVFVTRHMV